MFYKFYLSRLNLASSLLPISSILAILSFDLRIISFLSLSCKANCEGCYVDLAGELTKDDRVVRGDLKEDLD